MWVILLQAFFSSCLNSSDEEELKLAHSLPGDHDHPVHKAMEFMALRTDELSKGKLTIKVYPSGQLGSEQQCLELLQIGSLAITKVSADTMICFLASPAASYITGQDFCLDGGALAFGF